MLSLFSSKGRTTVKEKPSIAVVINYCSNDYKFIKHTISNAKQFADEVVVVYSDHFFDGTPENLELLNKTKSENPQAKFIAFPYINSDDKPARYWHNLSRWLGVKGLSKSIDYVLFLDADEVVESDKINNWLSKYPLRKYVAVKLNNYWYFREPSFRADHLEDSAVLAKMELLTEEVVMGENERESIYLLLKGKKERKVMGLDGSPLIHHYSWVRDRQEMLKKVRSWGHNKDKNWEELVEKEFQGEFSGTDFVHGYKYKIVPPYIRL